MPLYLLCVTPNVVKQLKNSKLFTFWVLARYKIQDGFVVAVM